MGRQEEVELFTSTLAGTRAHGFVIYGPAGVGKSRLADEFLAVAAARGRSVARATATEGTRHTPLGALAHLLPPGVGDRRFDLVTLLDEVGAVLREQREGGPLVLFVDDLHLVDPTSATLLAQLLDADLVFLVATVRASEPVPAPLGGLWERARVRRVDLTDLRFVSIDLLLPQVLGAPVEARTVGEIWHASQGNVLFVRELVLGSLEQGRLSLQRGTWRLSGTLATSPRLAELMERRLGDLAPDEADALDILAVWEPVGLTELEALVGHAVLERLDAISALTIRGDGRRQLVTLSHPLYGEIIRSRMPTLKRRRLLLEQVERTEQRGPRRREDPLRIAPARLDASGAADPDLIIRAARLTRCARDFPQVAELAGAALLGVHHAEAGLLLGEALHELGRFEEAEVALAEAELGAQDDVELFVLVVALRCLNLMWGLHRLDDALVENRAAMERVAEPAAALELALNEAMLLTYSGRPQQALDALADIGELSDPRARAGRAIAEVPALIAVGRPETALNLARDAFAEHDALPDPVAIADASLQTIHQVYALTECGFLDEATVLAESSFAALSPGAAPDVPMWLAFQAGRSSLFAGRPATAQRWLSECVARCDEHHFTGPRRLALSYMATAHAWLGDGDAAIAARAEMDLLPVLEFVRAEQELGRAWALVASGDLPGARDTLLAAADLAATTGYATSEALLLHDIARLGDPASVADRLDALADRSEGRLIAAYARHARSLASDRTDLIVEAADDFAAIGAVLLAAEALTEAARSAQRNDEQRLASTLFTRAESVAEAAEGARTPALAMPTSFVPLTTRERDIATLAAQGETSKAIAEQLFLSVRTVNNHLQHIYAKLGVNTRRDLAPVLLVDPPTDAGTEPPPKT